MARGDGQRRRRLLVSCGGSCCDWTCVLTIDRFTKRSRLCILLDSAQGGTWQHVPRQDPGVQGRNKCRAALHPHTREAAGRSAGGRGLARCRASKRREWHTAKTHSPCKAVRLLDDWTSVTDVDCVGTTASSLEVWLSQGYLAFEPEESSCFVVIHPTSRVNTLDSCGDVEAGGG